jgi:hypothetical protein
MAVACFLLLSKDDDDVLCNGDSKKIYKKNHIPILLYIGDYKK